MKLLIKLVDDCQKNRRGEFIIQSKTKAEIRISRRLNKTVSDFAETLLHELLHFWCTILQTHGLARPKNKEHSFIYVAVDEITHVYNSIFRRTK